MKTFLVIVTLAINSLVFGQADKKVDSKDFIWNTKLFYNADNKEVKERAATYYLLVNINSNDIVVGKVRSFDVNKDILLWEGSYFLFNRNEPNKNKYQGLCLWYYKNKQVSRESTFKDGVLEGKTIFYDEGGNKTYSGVYKNGKLDGGKMIQYNEDGVTGKIYMQNFDGFYDSWDVEKGKDGESNIENGALWITSKSKDGYTRKEYMQVDTKNDFSIETGIRLNGGELFYILYGFKDFQNYHGVIIDNRGYLRLQHFYEGINVEKNQWFKIKINSKWNTLKVLRMGENVYVSFNSNVITSYKFSKLYGNYLGYFLPKKHQEIGISYIRAKEFSYLTKSDGNANNNETRWTQKEEQKRVNKNREPSSNEISDASWNPAGTGFYVASNGLIVTNYHVIDEANFIGITQFVDGRKTILKAKVILSDPQNDLALLQVDDNKFISPGVLPYNLKPDVAEVGESIFTMGYPLTFMLGDEIKITDGIISARSGYQGDSKMYQISAAITYGNSGGPLFDKIGNLLGMNSSVIKYKDIAENTGYSIKTSMILNLLNSSNDPIIIENKNLLKGKDLKDQIKILRNFVPMICIQ